MRPEFQWQSADADCAERVASLPCLVRTLQKTRCAKLVCTRAHKPHTHTHTRGVVCFRRAESVSWENSFTARKFRFGANSLLWRICMPINVSAPMSPHKMAKAAPNDARQIVWFKNLFLRIFLRYFTGIILAIVVFMVAERGEESDGLEDELIWSLLRFRLSFLCLHSKPHATRRFKFKSPLPNFSYTPTAPNYRRLIKLLTYFDKLFLVLIRK